ncbi:MAG: transglycosylase domain-containing protein [Acidimicrobiales bacterium]
MTSRPTRSSGSGRPGSSSTRASGARPANPRRPKRTGPTAWFLGGPRTVRNRRRNPLWRFRRFLLLMTLFGFGLALGGVALLAREELPADDFGGLAQTSFICSAEVVAECDAANAAVALSAGEDRVVVDYDEIPQVLIDAVVSAEDKNFFDDRIGVDPFGIARALYQNTREGRAAQGGSTITQQYVKNAFAIDADRNLVTKLKEAALAVKLTRELPRDEILERYLNRIYFGRGAYGVQAAATNYFDKDVAELTLAEAAYLAGLIRAPSSADAATDPEEADRRRQTVLVRMVADGYITQADADAAAAIPVAAGLVARQNREGLGDVVGSDVASEYFFEAVRQQLVQLEDEVGEVYSSGLRVYTTLDLELQRAAFTSVLEVVGDPRFEDVPSASIVAIDNEGRVQAMVGGYDFSTSQVNLALGQDGGGSGRQPGSSFKTFALAEAIEQQISAESFYAAPSVIEIPGANDGGPWVVRGGGSPDGYRSLIDALRVSSNVVYAQLMVQLTPHTVVKMAHDLGVSADLPEVNALVLGSGEVSVLDMAASYSTLSNQGLRHRPVLIERIEDADGDVICWYPIDGQCAENDGRVGEQVIEAPVAQQVTYALQHVVEAGTGRAAGFGQPAAGKTGTTQDARDAWFVGYTCDFTAAVWMGFVGAPGEPVRTMQNVLGIDEVHGGDFPAQIWSAFMGRASTIRGGGNPYPCDSLAVSTDFTGTVFNRELSTTTLPPCASVPEPDGSTTTAEGATTSTTEPCDPNPPPVTGPDGQPIETTTTVPADGSTTAPGDSTAPSSTTPSSTAPSSTASTRPTVTQPTVTQPTVTQPEVSVPAGDG